MCIGGTTAIIAGIGIIAITVTGAGDLAPLARQARFIAGLFSFVLRGESGEIAAYRALQRADVFIFAARAFMARSRGSL